MTKMAGNHTFLSLPFPWIGVRSWLSSILSSQNGLIARWVAALPDHALVLFLANWSSENDANFLAAEKGGAAFVISLPVSINCSVPNVYCDKYDRYHNEVKGSLNVFFYLPSKHNWCEERKQKCTNIFAQNVINNEGEQVCNNAKETRNISQLPLINEEKLEYFRGAFRSLIMLIHHYLLSFIFFFQVSFAPRQWTPSAVNTVCRSNLTTWPLATLA